MNNETSPSGGRRVIFYLFYDVRGVVDDYVTYQLEKLRPHAEHIMVVVNGELAGDGRERLAAVSDEVFQRPNVGFDVTGYKDGLAQFGAERLADFDELLLMNYTSFGPVRPFAPVFERMEAQELDFWGMTDHGPLADNPRRPGEVMPAHIQSHWVGVRRAMFTSEAWGAYWGGMPAIESYIDSIELHEVRFTTYFHEHGFRSEVAFPYQDYPGAEHPLIDVAAELLGDGCPILKRRIFFHDPLYLDRNAIIGRQLLQSATSEGYPLDLILANLARTTAPKILNTTASMLEIMPDADLGYDPTRPFRTAVAAHVYYLDLAPEMLQSISHIPGPYDLFVTTSDDDKAAAIRALLADTPDPHRGAVDVRVVASNRGRDIGAFFVGLRDVLVGGAYDVIVKIHTKKSLQESGGVGTYFRHQQIDNLLNSPGYAANLFALFQREPGLGVVFPPSIHIGFPTLGGSWFLNKEPAERILERIDVHVPLDATSPLAPLGSMYVVRPEAIAAFTAIEWSYDDYADEAGYADGALAHVHERIPAYVAAGAGYHARTVSTVDHAAVSHTFLEYKLDQLSAPVHGYIVDEVRDVTEHAHTARRMQRLGRSGFIKEYLLRFHPRATVRLIAMRNALRGRRDTAR